mgnify:CR=1 FL=1
MDLNQSLDIIRLSYVKTALNVLQHNGYEYKIYEKMKLTA